MVGAGSPTSAGAQVSEPPARSRMTGREFHPDRCARRQENAGPCGRIIRLSPAFACARFSRREARKSLRVSVTPSDDVIGDGPKAAAISNLVVRVLSEYT